MRRDSEPTWQAKPKHNGNSRTREVELVSEATSISRNRNQYWNCICFLQVSASRNVKKRCARATFCSSVAGAHADQVSRSLPRFRPPHPRRAHARPGKKIFRSGGVPPTPHFQQRVESVVVYKGSNRLSYTKGRIGSLTQMVEWL